MIVALAVSRLFYCNFKFQITSSAVTLTQLHIAVIANFYKISEEPKSPGCIYLLGEGLTRPCRQYYTAILMIILGEEFMKYGVAFKEGK